MELLYTNSITSLPKSHFYAVVNVEYGNTENKVKDLFDLDVMIL